MSRRAAWRRRGWVVASVGVAALSAVTALAGCRTVDTGAPSTGPSVSPSAAAAGPRSTTTAAPSPTTSPVPGTALAALATLAVKGRAPKTGYERDQFGQAWLDVDRNGCDTRNDVLRRDLTDLTVTAGTHGCRVEAGTLHDRYTGTTIRFVRGDDSIDVDHVVALSDAWQTGAFRWGISERAAFANDPLNLLAADSGANRQKGDGDTATWLPAYRPFRCAYAARQVSVKAKYRLWVTPAEHDAMARVLAGCPQRRVLRGGGPTRVPFPVRAPHASAYPSAGATARPAGGGGPVDYANCDAVRAAGVAPIHAGDPGYAPHLDRDGDGTGCE